MVNPRQFIEVRGQRREILITPSLYNVAKQRGWEIRSTEDMASIQSAYIKLIYAALINAYEVKKFDNPDTPDNDVTLSDVEIWAIQNPKEFGRLVVVSAEALTGKTLKELAQEKTEKKKRFFRLF